MYIIQYTMYNVHTSKRYDIPLVTVACIYKNGNYVQSY